MNKEDFLMNYITNKADEFAKRDTLHYKNSKRI